MLRFMRSASLGTCSRLRDLKGPLRTGSIRRETPERERGERRDLSIGNVGTVIPTAR